MAAEASLKEAPAPAGAPDYGLDAPLLVKRMFTRAAWTIAIGVAVYLINRNDNPGPAGTLLAVFGVIGLGFLAVGLYMTWSSRTGKLKLRDELLETLELKGDEKVLDAGCGRGLMVKRRRSCYFRSPWAFALAGYVAATLRGSSMWSRLRPIRFMKR